MREPGASDHHAHGAGHYIITHMVVMTCASLLSIGGPDWPAPAQPARYRLAQPAHSPHTPHRPHAQPARYRLA